MKELRLYLEGAAAEQAAREIEDFFAQEFGHPPVRVAPEVQTDRGKKADPVAVAALILTIPSAILATLDLAERIQLRKKLRRLIDLVRRQKAEKGTVIRLETPTGLQDLLTADLDRFLDAATGGSEPENESR
jgi:hypothetical protein